MSNLITQELPSLLEHLEFEVPCDPCVALLKGEAVARWVVSATCGCPSSLYCDLHIEQLKQFLADVVPVCRKCEQAVTVFIEPLKGK